MKMQKITEKELVEILKENNIVIRPSYKHEDYVFQTASLPYPVKSKLDRLSRKFGVSRSSIIRLLIESVEA